MLTLTQQRNLYGELTSGTANIANLNFGERIIQAETRKLVARMSDHLLHDTSTSTAVVDQQVYELPNDLKKLRGVTFSIGSTVRYIRQSPDRRHWDMLNTSTPTAFTASYPDWYYHIGKQVLYWPTPSSGSAVITYDYDKIYTDQTVADYTTGTINQVTQGSTTVVGASTSWGSAIVGRQVRIDKSNTFANDGDGNFYEIGEVINATNLNLTKIYQGHTIGNGAATYAIGEISLLPDGFHELPVYRAVQTYYSKTDQARSVYFRDIANELEDGLFGANDPSDKVAVENEVGEVIYNPNFYPRDLT